MKHLYWLSAILSLFILGCSLEEIPAADFRGDISQGKRPRPTPTATPVPVLDEPSNGATGVAFNIGLFWDRATVKTGSVYRLQLSTNPSFAGNVLDVSVSYNAYAAINLLRNTTYYWRVNVTILSRTSPWSEVFRFTTLDLAPPTATPILVSPPDGATGLPLEPVLTWGSAEGATSYDVQVAGERTFSGPIIQWYGFEGTTFIARGLEEDPLRVYYWRVRARNAAGASSVWSAIRSFSVEGF